MDIPYSYDTKNPSLEVIKNEKIQFNDDVTFQSRHWEEIFYYTREFETKSNFKLVTINLNIPFTGTTNQWGRARILLYLDEEIIGDSSIHGCKCGDCLRPLNIMGTKINLNHGKHKMKLMALTDSKLWIPHYCNNNIENMEPKMAAFLTIIGQN